MWKRARRCWQIWNASLVPVSRCVYSVRLYCHMPALWLVVVMWCFCITTRDSCDESLCRGASILPHASPVMLETRSRLLRKSPCAAARHICPFCSNPRLLQKYACMYMYIHVYVNTCIRFLDGLRLFCLDCCKRNIPRLYACVCMCINIYIYIYIYTYIDMYVFVECCALSHTWKRRVTHK